MSIFRAIAESSQTNTGVGISVGFPDSISWCLKKSGFYKADKRCAQIHYSNKFLETSKFACFPFNLPVFAVRATAPTCQIRKSMYRQIVATLVYHQSAKAAP